MKTLVAAQDTQHAQVDKQLAVAETFEADAQSRRDILVCKQQNLDEITR
jgi:hypothetical protein